MDSSLSSSESSTNTIVSKINKILKQKQNYSELSSKQLIENQKIEIANLKAKIRSLEKIIYNYQKKN